MGEGGLPSGCMLARERGFRARTNRDADSRRRRFRARRDGVAEYLDVGKAAEVVDRHVAVLPAGGPALPASTVHEGRGVVLATSDAIARATLDAAELLDVDVEELARA